MKNKPPLTVRVDPEVLRRVRELAFQQERTVSWVVNKALELYLRNPQQSNRPKGY